MKICIATDNYPPRYDGVSRFLREIIPALNKNHFVHVIAPDFGPTQEPWQVTKIPVTRFRIGDFHPAGLHFIKIYNRVKKADVVFIQALGTIGGLALIAAKLARKKVVLYTHSIEWELVPKSLQSNMLRRLLPGFIKWMGKIVYSWIHLMLVPSKGISETYYWNKIDNKRVIIPLGVDTKTFSPTKDRATAKNKLGIDENTLVIGYHGRLAREKDLKTLLRGFIRFRRAHEDIDMKLLVVGDGLREIRDMFEERDDCIVTGFVEDVVPYMHAMDIYVLSSQTETSCLAVMEAMSCGLAVVSTPVGYVRDYIQDGKNGLLYPEQDTVMLARHLDTLLDKKRRDELGVAARKTIVKDFSWNTTRKHIMKVFDQL